MNDVTHNGWERYYKENTNTSWKENVEEYLLERIDNYTGESALDIACGDGRNTIALLDRYNKVCCIDLSKTALQKLQLKFKDNGSETPLLIAGDFSQLEIINNQFDLIICFDGLPQMDNTKELLIKMCSLLKEGGILIFNFFTKNDCAYGEGNKIDDDTFLYKDTLFKFLNMTEVKDLLPKGVAIENSIVKKWDDPPHGDFRPYPHTHEAVFFTLRRS